MMNYRNAVIAAATMLTATTASAAPVTFFGEDRVTSGTQVTSRSNADAARTAFFDNLTGVGTETFEGFAQGTRTPLNINFTGAGTATLLGGGTVQTTSYGLSVGRYAISGTKYLDASSTFSLTFSDAISAFGFYGTDIGDIGSALSLTLTGTNGVTVLNVPNFTTGTGLDGSALYYGFYDTTNTYTSISFAGAGTDVFGFDDFSIGSRAQVTPGAVPEPASWAMMILGVGAVGFAMRSAKRRSDARFDYKIKRIAAGFAV